MGIPSPSMKKRSLMCLSPTTTYPSTVPPWDTRQITPSLQTASTTCEYGTELPGQIGALSSRARSLRRVCSRCHPAPQKGHSLQVPEAPPPGASGYNVKLYLTSPSSGLRRLRSGKALGRVEMLQKRSTLCCFVDAFFVLLLSHSGKVRIVLYLKS